MTDSNFTEEFISVGDLDVDRAVQRSSMDVRKVERFARRYNPAALGVITVSKRNEVTYIIIDGMHRTEATRRVTDGTGKLLCHVFHGLTIAEEAQMFLDLNAGNQPTLIDKFKVRITAGDPQAIKINEMVRSYGWTVHPAAANGAIQCVGTLERIQNLSDLHEVEPGLLQVSLMTVTHAWGHDRDGAQAGILEGIGLVYDEYRDLINLDRFSNKLKNYQGGPQALLVEGRTMAAYKKAKVPFGLAERLVDEYNVGAKTKSLHPWRRRK